MTDADDTKIPGLTFTEDWPRIESAVGYDADREAFIADVLSRMTLEDKVGQMIPNLSASRRFKSYVGLRGAEAKLVRLLNDFTFVDVRTAVSRVDWETVPVVQV